MHRIRVVGARRLSRREFARALRLGLGRARLDVRRHGLAGREDLLVAACLRDTRIIRELEESPGRWLAAIARDGGVTDVVRDAVISAAMRPGRKRDRALAAHVLTALAQDGDARARRGLVRIWESSARPESRVAERVIQLLGETGWRRVVRGLARRWPLPDEFDLGWVAYVAREFVGPRRALAALPHGGTARTRACVAALRLAIAESGRRWRTPTAPPEPAETLGSLERMVRAPQRPRSAALWNWARRASAADRERAWRRLAAERSTRRLLRRLRAMDQDPAPTFRPVLVRLTRHRNTLVRINAWGLLRNVTGPRVRDFALDAVRRIGDRAVRDGALGCLERNGRDEDAAAVAAAFPTRGDVGTLHSWVRGALYAARPLSLHSIDRVEIPPRTGPAWDSLLVRAYEASPCRSCREAVLEALVERGAAPPALLREALWDAQEETRRVARRAIRALAASPTVPARRATRAIDPARK